MRTTRILRIVFLLAVARLAGQGQSYTEAYRTLPGEAIYVHQNSNLLFAGETLYYKLYCMNTSSKQPSTLSKIAYVAMVGRDLEPVFQHKIRLKDGLGQGDFFVPADVPTGSYKLIAYTNWMKNDEGTPVFTSDIMLINPYQNTPERYMETPMPDSLRTDSLPREKTVGFTQPQEGSQGIASLSASLDKTVFGTRERVTLSLMTSSDALAGGHYSLSVRRAPEIVHPVAARPVNILYNANRASGTVASGAVVLPELRGELLSGKVVVPDGSGPARNVPLALSMPGDEFVFDMARTNEDGRFYFNLDREYNNNTGIFQVVNREGQDFDIQLEPEVLAMPATLEFYDFTLNDGLADEIRKRSIQNQIENAYVEVKADTIIQRPEALPFYRDFQLQYHLDDYTRFNTIEETLVEIVDQVWLSKDAKGEPMFQVRPFDGYLDGIGMPPMVFMDGLFIQHHADIVDFPARQIKNIFISRDRYQIGANVFQGILAFETFSSDFSETFFRDFLKSNALFKPESGKAYYFQSYEEGRQERIPDFRQQLYWAPNVTLTKGTTAVYWYTSDLKGRFEIRLQGYTAAGLPVSLVQTFVVE